jgi:hypothetical protein
VGLAIDYYGSVNSYADRDCNRLAAWAEDGRTPESVSALTKAMVENLDLLQPFSREGSILGRTVMALLVSTGALDWGSGQIPVSNHDTVDFHHMVPEQRLKNWYTNPDDRRPIAGLTPVWATTNRSLGNLNAADVFKKLGNDAMSTMKSHNLDPDMLKKAWSNKTSFEKFRKDRAGRLKVMIIESLGL